MYFSLELHILFTFSLQNQTKGCLCSAKLPKSGAKTNEHKNIPNCRELEDMSAPFCCWLGWFGKIRKGFIFHSIQNTKIIFNFFNLLKKSNLFCAKKFSQKYICNSFRTILSHKIELCLFLFYSVSLTFRKTISFSYL